MFRPNAFAYDWVDDLEIFYQWLMKEKDKCVPKGVCGQSVDITSGRYGLRMKYSNFEDAYEAYRKDMDNIET